MDRASDLFHSYSSQIQPYLPYIAIPLGLYGVYKGLSRLIPGPQQQARLDLRNKTVLITGASSGLGRALAFEFYKQGAKLILTARSLDKLEALCDELEHTGWKNPNKPIFRYLDLADLNGESASQLDDLRQLSIDGQTIDVLVNNAGMSVRGSCTETPLSVHRQIMDVNYFGHVAVTKHLIDAIPDDGAIVTISSIQGKVAIPFRSAYSASKHAIQAYFDSLRSEDRPNLQILTVSAGYINTGFGARALGPDGRPVGIEDPNQKAGMSPEYVSRAIVESLCNRQTELILAPFTHKLAIFMRIFTPNLLFWMLWRRGRNDPYRKMK